MPLETTIFAYYGYGYYASGSKCSCGGQRSLPLTILSYYHGSGDLHIAISWLTVLPIMHQMLLWCPKQPFVDHAQQMLLWWPTQHFVDHTFTISCLWGDRHIARSWLPALRIMQQMLLRCPKQPFVDHTFAISCPWSSLY